MREGQLLRECEQLEREVSYYKSTAVIREGGEQL